MQAPILGLSGAFGPGCPLERQKSTVWAGPSAVQPSWPTKSPGQDPHQPLWAYLDGRNIRALPINLFEMAVIIFHILFETPVRTFPPPHPVCIQVLPVPFSLMFPSQTHYSFLPTAVTQVPATITFCHVPASSSPVVFLSQSCPIKPVIHSRQRERSKIRTQPHHSAIHSLISVSLPRSLQADAMRAKCSSHLKKKRMPLHLRVCASQFATVLTTPYCTHQPLPHFFSCPVPDVRGQTLQHNV